MKATPERENKRHKESQQQAVNQGEQKSYQQNHLPAESLEQQSVPKDKLERKQLNRLVESNPLTEKKELSTRIKRDPYPEGVLC